MPRECSYPELIRARRMFARFLAVALLAMLIGSVQSLAAADKIDPVALKKVKAATVHLRVVFADGDVSEGSGFVARAKGLIITNAHVVGMLDNDSPRPKKIEATFNSGEPNSKTVTVKVGYVDGESDLALLSVASKDMAVIPELLPIGLSQKLMETQDVFIVGYPLGKQAGPNVTVTATTVTSLRKEGINIKQVQVNGGMHPGNSGGPVVDKDGSVVGIAQASYSGTQLHLAIPTEIFNTIVNGRIMNSTYAVPYRDGDKIRVPFHFEKADPLNTMKSISVESWIGKPGPLRPSTQGKKPDPLPDDSPVTVLEVKPDEKGLYAGELVLDGNKDPKMAYWTRYQLGRPSRTDWYPASTITARLGTPVDRKPATLNYNPPLDRTDVLALTSDGSFRIREASGEDVSIGMIIKGTFKEKVTAKSQDGFHKSLTFDGLDATLTKDKKPLEGADQFLKALKDSAKLAAEIDVDKNGAITRDLIDFSKVPRASQRPVMLVGRQVQQSLDSLAPPLPLKEMAAQETWKGKHSYLLGALNIAVGATAEVTYKFEGIFERDQKTFAVITFEGPLQGDFEKPKGKREKEPVLTGKVDGKIEVLAETGVVQSATEKIRAEVSMEDEGKPLKLIGTLNVQLRRNPPPAKK